MPEDPPTRRDRRTRILYWVTAACLVVALVGALLDGRLIRMFALMALALVFFVQATRLGERSAVARWLSGVLATVGLVLAAIVLYEGLTS